MMVEVYTDGSGTTKATPGGYGYVIVIDGVKRTEGSGHMNLATNNDAEMEAAIQGLATAQTLVGKEDYEVWLVSDSQIILGWATGRYEFKQEEKMDKYELLQKLMLELGVRTRWVRGHNGDQYNEQCDKLAKAARLQEKQ